MVGVLNFRAPPPSTAGGCVSGRVTSVAAPAGVWWPGAAAPDQAAGAPTTVSYPSRCHRRRPPGARLVVATSADADGRFSILFTPGQTFRVSAEMTAFTQNVT
jgi:hypothetical protein